MRGSRFASTAGLLFSAGLILAGCSSSSGVTDMLGMGKNVPDEREVRTHQVLAMPPSLSLPPPAETSHEGMPNVAAQEAEAAIGRNALSAPPEQALQNAPRAPSTPPQTHSQQVAAAAPAAPAAPAAAPQTAAPAAGGGDVYARYGISKVNPDGTPKSEAQLSKELREKYVAEQKAKNPNYGSIFNIGNLFSD